MMDSSNTSIYNEATPSSSNFMYSGTYSGPSFFINTTTSATSKVCCFTPENTSFQTTSFTANKQISIITNITQPLTRTITSGLNTVKWGTGNSLLNANSTYGYTKSFGLRDLTTNKFITLVSNLDTPNAPALNDKWYIHPNFFGTANNASPLNTALPTNSLIPFSKFISMSSATFGSNSGSTYTSSLKPTTQTFSIENKNSIAQSIDLKMYLGTSTGTLSSVLYNPYGVRVTVRDSLTSTILSTTTSNNNNNVYCISSGNTELISLSNLNLVKQPISTINIPNFLLEPNQIMDITLMKIVSSPSYVGSQDVAILFIDIENLLYTTPVLTLSSTGEETIGNVKTYYYGNETNMEFSCMLTPNNINGDNINGQNLNLNIYKKNSVNVFEFVADSIITSSVSSNNATFKITDNNKYDYGEYKAVVKYDSSQVNIDKLPDAKSHYKNGTSNEILFSIGKQHINVVYNPTKLNISTNNLTAFNSILQNASFEDFLIYNSKSNTIINIPGSINFTVKDTNNNTLFSQTKSNFSDLQFLPKSNNFTYASTYNFNLTFTPTNINILPFITTNYFFTTETPILSNILYNSNNETTTSLLLSYLSNATIECILKDTNGDKYDSTTVSSTSACVTNFYKHPNDQTKDINLALIYDTTSKTWKKSFTPKILNLLRYDMTDFNIESSFILSRTSGLPITLTTDNSIFIQFKGIQLVTSIHNTNPNTYDTVVIKSYIHNNDDNNIKYSIIDIPGYITYIIKDNMDIIVKTQYITTQNSTDNSLEYSFIPNDLNISSSTNPLTIYVSFKFTDDLVSTINKQIPLNIGLIKPTIGISPNSETNDYHFGQTFQVSLTGFSEKYDLGTLFLYGKSINSNPDPLIVRQIENAMLNQLHTFTNINIDDLVEDNVLSNLNLNQNINGTIKWIPNNQNIYESVQDTFNIVLSKTTTNITNLVISNNNCVFTQEIIISCNVVSDYTETIKGTIRLYDVNDANKTIISQSSVSNDNFSLKVTSLNVISYRFALEFIPEYGNVYQGSTNTSTNNVINFTKAQIVPMVTITNLNTALSSTANTVDMPYTNNFKIDVTNMKELDGTFIKISIGDEYISNELIVNNGQIETTYINYFKLNKDNTTQINITNSKPITIEFIGYDSSESLKSLYNITIPNKNIRFVKDLTLPKINNITFNSQVTNQDSTSLNYDEIFTINGNFNLIKDLNNAVIPLQGTLLLFVGSIYAQPIVLNDNLILDDINKVIVDTFKSSTHEIFVGNNTFIFKFVSIDTNISPIFSNPVIYQIIPATISTVGLDLYPNNSLEHTYFGESFGGTINFVNIGIIGTMKIYCINPENSINRQEIASIGITQNDAIGPLSRDFVCSPITFDCPGITTTYNIVVVFLSGDTNKFSDNEMLQIFNYNISYIEVKLSALTFNGVSFSDFNNQKLVGDILTIRGTINTINDTAVKEGHVELIAFNISSEDGMYYNTPENTLRLNNANAKINIADNDYVSIAEDGTFICTLLLTNELIFFNYPGTRFQLLYRNNKNYNNKYFSYEDIPGIYELYINNKDIDLESIYFTLDKSQLTSSYNFSYHEDILHFYVEINEEYNISTSPSIILQLSDVSSGAPVGNGNNGSVGSYDLEIKSLTKYNKTIYFAEKYLNPKTENIIKNGLNDYSASCTFNANGYNSANEVIKDITNNQLYFNIVPTIPVIELEFNSTQVPSFSISSINYEESVNITVKVKPFYTIQEHVIQSNNILGTIVLKNQKSTNNENGTIMNILFNSQTSNNIVFNSIETYQGSSDGKIVIYSPKKNSDNVITNIANIFASFSPNYQDVNKKYTTAKLSKSFTISKYAPELNISAIFPTSASDILHMLPDGSKVDDKFVYYDDVNNVVYNGFINFDETFQVDCSLNKNLAGTIEYYYSSTNNQNNNVFTKITPITTIVTGKNGEINEDTNVITAIFNEKLLQIPENHLYYLKTIFNPNVTSPLSDSSYFYSTDDSPLLYFNVFQSNKFGTGNIFWDTNNNSIISKTRSYNDTQTITINVSFVFDASINKPEKKCEVTFFHTSFENPSNIFYGPIYIDFTTSNQNTYSQSFTIPATTFVYNHNAYSIRALFKPVTDTGVKNSNYPIVVERIPLTLTIKPFITTNLVNFTYKYSDKIDFIVNLNSGTNITDISPYTNLVFDVKNYDSNTELYSKTDYFAFTGVSAVLSDFQNIINTSTINLIPGKYSLTIYATDSNNSSITRTETFSTTFTIIKKDVIPHLTFDKYTLTYKNPLIFSLNIGNFLLDNGNSVITFTNINTNLTVQKIIVNNTLSLINGSQYNYTYTVADISTVLSVGIYNVDLVLNNKYYQGSQTRDTSYILLVNKDMAIISLPNNINNIKYGESIILTASIKYESTPISTGQLSLTINNGISVPVSREFAVISTSLNKDINNLVLSFVDDNYVARSYAFQINVTKQLTNLPEIVLSTGSSTSTESAFFLNLSNVVSSDVVTFYNLSSISELAFTSSSTGVYSFNFTNLRYGDNNIYAIARSSTRDIKSKEVTIHRNKYAASIVLDSTTFSQNYIANSLINIKYKVSGNNNITNGTVEFHKLIYEDNELIVNHDEIIGYDSVLNGYAQITNYKLVANSNIKLDGSYYDNKIKFYAKFINSTDFEDCESVYSSLISVKTKSASKIIDDTLLPTTSYLGDTVYLEYIAVKDSSIIDGTITTTINAEQKAIIDYETANSTLTSKNDLLSIASTAYNTASEIATTKSGDLTTATNALSAATNELTIATNALAIAKLNLDAVDIDKEKAELAFKTIQEVTKLNNMSFPLASAQSSVSDALLNYESSETIYTGVKIIYNNILLDIASKQTHVTSKEAELKTAQQAYDEALTHVTSKESELNIAQQAYEAKLLENNNDLLAIKGKQNEIIANQQSIAVIEDEYDTKKTNYETQLAIYTQIAASSDAASSDADTNYASINNLLNTENTNNFTLGDLSNIWMVIDQQSTSSTPQNPFIIVYTIKDSITSNASWYKSKLFYGSNTGADIQGPMLLYTGEDPTDIHSEILNRVKLDLNVGLSRGNQTSDEIVKAISIQTSSNMPSTNVNDYNFIFKELKTIGTNNAHNLSFLPTSSNNVPSVYADGVQGIEGVEGANGWGFNNNALTNEVMPKINWYVISNKSEEYTAQLAIESAAKISAQNSKTDAYAVFETYLNPYNIIKTTYDGFSIVTKNIELLMLNSNEFNSNSALAILLANIDTIFGLLNSARTTTSSKTSDFNNATTIYNNAFTELTTSKAPLIIVTNGKTLFETLNDLLDDKHNKYVTWNSFVEYIHLLTNDMPVTINSVLAKMSDEVSIDFDNKFIVWNNALNEVNSKTGAQAAATLAQNAATLAQNASSSDVSIASTAKTSASDAVSFASTAKNNASTEKNNASTASANLLDPIALTSGYVVFYKEVSNNGVTMTQILGQIKPDTRGVVGLPYKLVDTGDVNFYAKITDLPDYYDYTTATKTTTVSRKNTISITNNTVLNLPLYKIGDTIPLSYKVTASLSPVTEGTIAIYKTVSGNEQLLKCYALNTTNQGIILHNHTLIDSGSVSFYAKYIYSSNNTDKIGSIQTISVVNKLNSLIQDISTVPDLYKLGSTVNIAYSVTSSTTNINEGVVEVHKLLAAGLDEIIGYLELSSSSNGNVSMAYDLVDVGTVQFYAVYIGTKNYFTANNNQTKPTLTVVDKYTAQVTNTSTIGSTKKLGDVVTLSYNISYNNAPVNEGVFEISKQFVKGNTTFNEILGYANINNGQASFTHKLVDIGDITLTCNFINSVNYKNVNFFTNTVNVIRKYVSNLVKTSLINNQYKLGDSLTLEYMITDDFNNTINSDGIIYIHKIITTSNGTNDEIIYYAVPDVNGKISYNHKITAINPTTFYAEFKESVNYDTSITLNNSIYVIKENTTVTNILSGLSVSKYGESITLTSTLSLPTINEGNMDFYVTINGSEQLIGTSSIGNGVATLNYTVNDIGSISFKSVFKNSSNYVDVTSSNINMIVSKNDIVSLVLPSISANKFDIVPVEAIINYGNVLCYENLGSVEFTITNEDIDLITNIDIIGNKATYKLYVANKTQYTIHAKYNGNDAFNMSTNTSISFTPSANTTYNALTYTNTRVTNSTNYYNMVATISLTNETANNKFLLLNTGWVVFETIINNTTDSTKTSIIPLVNGTAQCNLRKETGYIYAVKFVDNVSSPNVIITGTPN